MLIESKLHKEINGNIEGTPFNVAFDSDGRADVEEAVGEFLLRLHAADKIVKEIEETIDTEIEEKDVGDADNLFNKELTTNETTLQSNIVKQEENKELSEMSLSELKAEASRRGIKIGPGKTQKQIIAKIEGGK